MTPAAPEHPAPQTGLPTVSRRARSWVPKIALGAVGALLLGIYLVARLVLPGATVTVRNVGDRPLEGIVLLAVEEHTSHARREWPVGALRPGETYETERFFESDTNLAIRFRAAEGGVVERRTKIYLGYNGRPSISVDIAADEVVRVQVRSRAGDPVVKDKDVYPGLEPPAPGATPLPTPR